MRGKYLRNGVFGYTLLQERIHLYDIDLYKPYFYQTPVVVGEIGIILQNAFEEGSIFGFTKVRRENCFR